MHGPPARESQREHRADDGWLHYRAEGLVIVDTGALSKAPENPASLVTLKSAVSPALVGPDPLAGNDVGARRTRDPSHRVLGSTRSRNGNEERGTPIFNIVWNDEYTASTHPKLTWIEIQVNLGRRSRNDEMERGRSVGTGAEKRDEGEVQEQIHRK